MKRITHRGTRPAREVKGNVIWLTYPPRDRKRRSADPVTSLKQSVARLVLELERSGRLRTDIAAAVKARRYELYKNSTSFGVREAERSMAAAQQIHLNDLLRFLHATAAAKSVERAGTRKQEALDPLTRSIRELKTTMQRAQRLSQEVLAQSQRRDWSRSAPRDL